MNVHIGTNPVGWAIIGVCVLVVGWLAYGDKITDRFRNWRDRRSVRHYTAETLTPAAPADIAGPSPLTPDEDQAFRDVAEAYRKTTRKGIPR